MIGGMVRVWNDIGMGLRALALVVIATLAVLPGGAGAEAVSLLREGGFARTGGALVAIAQPGPGAVEGAVTGAGPSLFVGRAGASLFAPVAPRLTVDETADDMAWLRLTGARAVIAARIRDVIARAEAGSQGYDAVQHGATIPPPQRPTQLTIAQIMAWIDATPGQPHAIGRYQFIPSTLRRLVADLGVDARAAFSPAVQDALADRLLEEAGFSDLLAGRLERRGYMNNLARVWAGLPTSSGKSYYHGYAGNRATMSWAQFEAHMGKIFPG